MDIALHTARGLDGARKIYLRAFLRWDVLRALYVDRRTRLFSSFLAGAVVSLLLSAAFPLWVLALGPIFFGLPHLIASFRYSTDRGQSKGLFVGAALFLSTIVCLYRLAQLERWLPFTGYNSIELGALVLLFAVMCGWGRSRPRYLATASILLPLFVLSWHFPLPTVGALILVHNLIAFIYWHRSARESQETGIVSASLVVFLGANALIFLGGLDAILFRFTGDGESIRLGMQVWETGAQILPQTISYQWLSRAVVAYAFGQSVHYFIWLRAIPEQRLAHPTPTSFRQSLAFLRSDLGPRLARFSILAVLALTSVWALYEISWARMVYLCIAAFHGYAELAGLCLERGNA